MTKKLGLAEPSLLDDDLITLFRTSDIVDLIYTPILVTESSSNFCLLVLQRELAGWAKLCTKKGPGCDLGNILLHRTCSLSDSR